jgi:hypothetical protein
VVLVLVAGAAVVVLVGASVVGVTAESMSLLAPAEESADVL